MTTHEARKLARGRVAAITYRCRAMSGDDPEEGTLEAFWNGEIDTWGKRTIVPIDGTPTMYLFDDEIVTVDCY